MNSTLIKKVAISIRYDERGFACFPLEEDFLALGRYYNVHIPSLNPGMVRGNHYHPEKEEYVFIMGKGCRVVVEDMETKAREECLFQEQPDSMLVFPANVAHAIKNEGDEAVYLLCFNIREDGDERRPATGRAEILE